MFWRFCFIVIPFFEKPASLKLSSFCSRQSSVFLSATWLLLCLSVCPSIYSLTMIYTSFFFFNCVLIDLLVFQSKDWCLSTILVTSFSYYTFKYSLLFSNSCYMLLDLLPLSFICSNLSDFLSFCLYVLYSPSE